jgi:hypothetical protein
MRRWSDTPIYNMAADACDQPLAVSIKLGSRCFGIVVQIWQRLLVNSKIVVTEMGFEVGEAMRKRRWHPCEQLSGYSP